MLLSLLINKDKLIKKDKTRLIMYPFTCFFIIVGLSIFWSIFYKKLEIFLFNETIYRIVYIYIIMYYYSY